MGGYVSVEQLASSIEKVGASGSRVEISGLMGYEPHLTGQKAQLHDKSVQDVLNVYRGFKQKLASSGLDTRNMSFNGAGSHTLKIYEKDDTMNDLSAGSAVVMPTDFDTYHLKGNRPACFIATPILKRYEGNPFYGLHRRIWRGFTIFTVGTGKRRSLHRKMLASRYTRALIRALLRRPEMLS